MESENSQPVEKRYDFMRDFEELQRLRASGATAKKESLFSKSEWLQILGFQVVPVLVFAFLMFVIA
jgi:hypothetical protein